MTRPPRREKTTMGIAVAESTITHTRLMWGVEVSLFEDKSMFDRLLKSMATGAMAQCTETQ